MAWCRSKMFVTVKKPLPLKPRVEGADFRFVLARVCKDCNGQLVTLSTFRGPLSGTDWTLSTKQILCCDLERTMLAHVIYSVSVKKRWVVKFLSLYWLCSVCFLLEIERDQERENMLSLSSEGGKLFNCMGTVRNYTEQRIHLSSTLTSPFLIKKEEDKQ